MFFVHNLYLKLSFLLVLVYAISIGSVQKVVVSGYFLVGVFLILVQLVAFSGRAGLQASRLDKKLLYLYFSYLVLFLISASRQIMTGEAILPTLFRIFIIISMSIIGIYAVSRSYTNNGFERFIKSLSWMAIIPIILNFILYLTGVERASSVVQEASLLGLLGISTSRVAFYFSYGINSYGPIAAIAFLAAYWSIFWSERVAEKLIYTVIAIISFASMLLVDSRGATGASILAILLMSINFRRPKLLVLIFCLAPFLFLILPILEILLLSSFQRGASEAGTLSNRTLFWAAIFDYLSVFRVTHIFGHNLFFQPEGLLFYSMDNDFEMDHLYFTMHNSIVQLTIQFGYMGLICFLFLVRRLATILAKFLVVNPNNQYVKFVSSVLLFVFFLGNMETIFTPSVYVFSLVVFFIICSMNAYFRVGEGGVVLSDKV
jgi:hypothetical protein